jgi:hypothetical protein
MGGASLEGVLCCWEGGVFALVDDVLSLSRNASVSLLHTRRLASRFFLFFRFFFFLFFFHKPHKQEWCPS